MLFNSSKQGIERLEVYDNEEDVSTGACQRIITLENCIKITHSSPNNIIIVTKAFTQHLSTLTDGESLGWVTALQAVAFKDDSSKRGSIDEDNDLYCSSGEGIFLVKLCTSDASNKCGFEPIKYMLLITATGIELKDMKDNKHRATWPFKYIRRYGYRLNKFSFEGGRKCETGEGTFHFEYSNQQEIFRCVSSKIKFMKKKMSGSERESLPRLDCGDQFDAAFHMEPRSRSPLPLSARSEELNMGSFSSIKSTSTAPFSVDSQSPLIDNSHKPSIKPKPAKPPRKHIFPIAKKLHEEDFKRENIDLGRYQKTPTHEVVLQGKNVGEPLPVPPYDEVEVRSEAWKSRGINDIDHVEFIPQTPPKINTCERLISRSQDNLLSCGESSKIIVLPTNDVDPRDASYDRLQHFGSSHRSKRSDGYNMVLTRPPVVNVNNNKETWNDYDEVENVMQSVRLADDSYMGYGMIRKPSIPGPQVAIKSKNTSVINSDESTTYYQNGSEYALVSKPRRV